MLYVVAMAPRDSKWPDLRDGYDMTTAEFHSRRSDTAFFINAGGVLHLTVSGTRRMSLVPVEIGETYESAKAGGFTAAQVADAMNRGLIVTPEVVAAWAAADTAGISPDRFLELVLNAVEEEQAAQRITADRLEDLVDSDRATPAEVAERLFGRADQEDAGARGGAADA
jgi:hypothetical protein